MISMIIGVVGSLLVILAYVNTTEGLEGWSGSDAKFLWTNLIGQTLLLISLAFHPNFGSILIELFLIAVTIRGLYRSKRTVKFVGLKFLTEKTDLNTAHLVLKYPSGLAVFVSLHSSRFPLNLAHECSFIANLETCEVYKDVDRYAKPNSKFWRGLREAFYENPIHQVFCEEDWNHVRNSSYAVQLP